MYSIIRLIRWRESASESQRADAARHLSQAGSEGTVRQFIAPTLPGVRNGGDVIWHVVFGDGARAEAWARGTAWGDTAGPTLDARAAHVDYCAFEHGDGGARQPDLRSGLYRALFFSLTPQATAEQAAELEHDLLAMPRHIDKILNWRLSRVNRAGGAEPWSYVWEQEFESLAHLTQDYVWHPYHWGFVDRWFDPEMPCRIVRSNLCHTFASIRGSVLGSA
jgi:hypothetical protein